MWIDAIYGAVLGSLAPLGEWSGALIFLAGLYFLGCDATARQGPPSLASALFVCSFGSILSAVVFTGAPPAILWKRAYFEWFVLARVAYFCLPQSAVQKLGRRPLRGWLFASASVVLVHEMHECCVACAHSEGVNALLAVGATGYAVCVLPLQMFCRLGHYGYEDEVTTMACIAGVSGVVQLVSLWCFEMAGSGARLAGGANPSSFARSADALLGRVRSGKKQGEAGDGRVDSVSLLIAATGHGFAHVVATLRRTARMRSLQERRKAKAALLDELCAEQEQLLDELGPKEGARKAGK
ncbi:uncharacterized protein MONOS_10009 [Monocercomonoides exilis]|uniref:uncharacterized protein n=1 Tax=Monocercomonoides exilis TaxID=2049356 RepID=UPI00355A2333|nr:hypothetical protein MONOS_10009 [Monocercomonoides exilis]|eukprot:MONOS_10009.1-p1 / transcript=MONOS_10009.1 / gene=MONOS_10009 / organism=Monocercomonoides_exilis_PA203 / gene_product=unspecified product / transcript_product=unspecified product / location=Mono_scaffold00436:49117-50634(+) / protein_length=297 / sequence_SO=supercontig / SO=protein_coding / is_pseudo=false